MSEAQVTNWAGNVIYEARERRALTSLEEVQAAVCDASARGMRVRVVGTRHCFNDLADTDGLHLSLRDLPRRVEVADDHRTVTIDGGATYAEVNAVLAGHGLALANLASLPHITVAGAVATATHGSGDGNQSLASAVRSLTHVTASGELHTAQRGDAGFAHYPVHLGIFGPVVEMTLDVVPAFDVATTVYEGLDFAVAVEHFDEITPGLYSFSLAPDWSDGGRGLLFAKRLRDRAAPAELFGARAATVARHPSPGADPAAVTAQLGSFGASHERLTHFRSEFEPSVGDEVQSEYLIPRRHARGALGVLPRFDDVFATLAHSMEIRSVAADALSASPFHSNDCVAVHVTWRREPDAVRSALGPIERALEPFDARPHWGKVSVMPPAKVRELFPHLVSVDDEARRHDPAGIFRNAWTDRVFGDSAG